MPEREILRNQRRRLGIIRQYEEVTRNKAKTARYFGISRAIFYRWYDRYQKYGVDVLTDQSRRPLNSPGQPALKSLGR
jgi:transposase